MKNLRLLLVISLGLLLVSGAFVKVARAEEEDIEDFGEDEGLEGQDFPEGDEDDFGGGMPEPEDDNEIPDGDDGDVISLTNDTFAERVKSGKSFMVEFYAPWCGHCKALAPEYKAAAATLKALGVELTKIDATKFEALASENKVEGYPTILWITGKSSKPYNGGRTSSDIVTWVKKRIGFAVTTLATEEEAKKFLEDNDAIVAGYFKDLKGKEAKAFSESGKEADDLEYVQTDKLAVAAVLGLSTKKAAAVAVIKKEADKFVEFDGKYEADAITQFSLANRLPLFVTFTDEAAQQIFGGPIKKVVFLFFPDSEYEARTKDLAAVAREFKGKIIYSYINSSNEEMENVREFFGVTVDAKRALGFSTENREDGEKFAMDGELTAANLKAFSADFASGKAKPFFKSEPIPEKNDEPVKVVVGDSFETLVLDKTKDVLLEVYAPWCGHCKALEPIYNKLGKRFESISSVVIAKMDGTANEHPDIKIEGFPTILFYPATNKTAPITVDVDRKIGSLVSFLEEHASIPFSLPDAPDEPEEEEAPEEHELADEEEERLAEEAEAEAAREEL